MVEVLGTAAGVGGATVFGAAVGFLFKNISEPAFFLTLKASTMNGSEPNEN